jgi:phosphoesterase RecJ-like protein
MTDPLRQPEEMFLNPTAPHTEVAALPWEKLRALMEEARRILLVSHNFPEADSMGSQVALALHLKAQGKDVRICNPTPALPMCRFLEDMARRGGVPVTAGTPRLKDVDLIVVVDVCDWSHMGTLGERLRGSSIPRVCLDHHDPRGSFTELDFIDPNACATGEIVHRYLTTIDAPITAEMASALYAALVFDTGCFRLPNTKDETLLLAGELVRRGASHTEILSQVFGSESYGRMELLRVALANLVTEYEGRLAWATLGEGHFKKTGTGFNDGDGILDQLLPVVGLEVGVLFREWSEEGVKATFRSKGAVDVSEIAHSLGGGGRATASGVLLPLPMREAIETVLPPVREAVCGTSMEQL